MIRQQAILFVVTGIINTIFSLVLYNLLLLTGLNYFYALTIATILGVLFNFKSIGKLVFKVDNNQLIIKFVLVYLFLYFVNLLAIKILTSHKIDAHTAGLITIIPAAGISFLLNKYWVFKK